VAVVGADPPPLHDIDVLAKGLPFSIWDGRGHDLIRDFFHVL
jgi:hypothetical protein